MKKSALRKYSSVFLATVLVAGIIAVSSTSFMMGAQAQQEYGMDHYKKKVKVEKIKCINDNFNIDVSNSAIIPQIENDIKKLNGQNKNEDKKWVLDEQIILICNNYNDPVKFTLSQPEQTERSIQPQPEQNENSIVAQGESVGCQDCLGKLSTDLQEKLITSIANLQNPIIQIGKVSLDFTGITETSTLADISNIIDAAVKANGPISLTEMTVTFKDLLPNLDSEGQDQVAEVLLSLLNAKILENDAKMT